MKKSRVLVKIPSLCLAILLGLAAIGIAGTHFEDASLFGNLSQGEPALRYAFDHNSCPSTAVVNALVFLQKKYPSVYGTSLVPGYDTTSMVSVALALGDHAYMNAIITKDGNDTVTKASWNYVDSVWGPNLYIESLRTGKTIYSVQKYPSPPQAWVRPQPAWCSESTSSPTIKFIADALDKSQALFITWNQVNPTTGIINWSGAGHYLTVTGVDWHPATMTGTLYYMDPSYGSLHNSPIWFDQATGSRALWIDYGEDNGVPWVMPESEGGGDWWYHGDAQITLAMAMGPAPLPPTVLLLGSGLVGLIGWRRFRKG